MRHYYASNLAEQELPLTAIQSNLGHSQATTNNNYLREIRGGRTVSLHASPRPAFFLAQLKRRNYLI